MKNLLLNIVILIILAFSIGLSQGGILVNDFGTIQNNGVMKVNSDGTVRGLPDTLGGRVEFLSDVPGIIQYVPNVSYKELYISGRTRKVIMTDIARPEDKPMGILDSLIVNSEAELTVDTVDIEVLGYLGLFTEVRGKKQVIMKRELEKQDISGAGRVTNLTIDNESGVDIIDGGGFTVNRRLTLLSGELRNAEENNFIVADSALIERHVGASLAFQPQFEGVASLSYKGDGSITTGAEVPEDEEVLEDLIVENSFGLTLDRNVTANDSIYIRESIKAYEDTLTFTNITDPHFAENNANAEIEGNFKRTNLVVGDTILFNNPYTFVIFNSDEDLGSVASLTSSAFPRTYNQLPEGDQDKVERALALMAEDENGEEVLGGFNFDFHYGWRNAPTNEFIDETNGLFIEDLVLQKWLQDEWIDLESEVPSAFLDNWASSYIANLDETGIFAIGYPAQNAFNFSANFLLEGPYNTSRPGTMRDQLLTYGLLDQLPNGDTYPLNLDPTYNPEFISVPDSTVDLVVIGFREDRNAISGNEFYKTAFLRKDGQLIDIRGRERLRLTVNDGINPDGGDYWVTIHHRNHASIITSGPVRMVPGQDPAPLDFTRRPTLAEGGSTGGGLLRVDVDENGTPIYALKAGFLVRDDNTFSLMKDANLFITRETDYIAPWKLYTNEGYLMEDYDLNGIITTKDFNYSWNNREKTQ